MRNKRGVLLTLAMLVLFILMLGELSSYVDISISYEQLASATSAAFSSSALLNFISSGSGSFLAASLNNSLKALTVYESTPSLRKYHFINNTAYALTSLMDNGIIYGTDMSSYMGGAMLVNYTSALERLASLQGGSFAISNLSISVYQGGPLNITAKLTGLVTLNLSTGIINYPISSTANVSINGTQSLLGAERGATSYVTGAAPPQTIVGNTKALAGSRSPFIFAYGTAIYIGGTPTCSNVPSGFQNANYILVTPNAGSLSSNICGMGGLVTNSLGSLTPLFPYLIYQSGFISPNVIGNGTSVLLDGSALTLLNLTPVQAGIQNGYYYPASGAPSYLQQSQQQGSVGSGQGSFSLGALNTKYAHFNGANSYVQINNTQQLQLSNVTISGWVDYAGPASSIGWLVAKEDAWGVGACGSSLNPCFENWAASTQYTSSTSLSTNNWYFMTAVISGGTETVYVDGANVLSDPSSVLNQNVGIQIGYGNAAGQSLNGKATDIQIYANALTPAQVQSLYLNNSISGVTPVAYWPLSVPYQGMLNQTQDIIGNNNGYIRNSSGICTVKSMITGACGASIAQT